MAASVHNFILTYEELQVILSALDEQGNRQFFDRDTNGANRTKALETKIREQRDSGYPAKDYPFWINYLDPLGGF